MVDLRALVESGEATPLQRLLRAEALAEAVAQALEAGDRPGSMEVLAELRDQAMAPEASEPERLELATSLARVHGDALLAGDGGKARDVLEELDELAAREEATEEQRFVLANALSRGHWEAVRGGHRERAEGLLRRLRALVMRPQATEAERSVFTQLLAGEVEEECGVLGDREVASTRLQELRAFALRPGADEGQRLSLARALRSAYKAACRAGDPASARRPLLAELRELCGGSGIPAPRRRVLVKALAEGHAAARRAGREALADKVFEELRQFAAADTANVDERLVMLEAHAETPWSTRWRARKKRGDTFLATADRLAEVTPQDAKRRNRLMAALVRVHAHTRAAGDDEFGDQVLGRLRTVAAGEERDLGRRLAFARSLADGLWASGRLRNRPLAEELMKELADLIALEPGEERDRVLLTRFLLKVQHRAAQVGDDQVSRTVLAHIWSLAGSPQTGAMERAVIAHGLVEAHDLALESGDLRLVGKILDALRQLAALPGATQDQWRELLHALEHSIHAEQGAGHLDVVEALEQEADQWRRRLQGAPG